MLVAPARWLTIQATTPDRGVREERDRDRAGGEPVEPVGEIHAVRGTRDHHEQEDVPPPGELEVDVDQGEEDARREVQVVDDDSDEGRDDREKKELPAA